MTWNITEKCNEIDAFSVKTSKKFSWRPRPPTLQLAGGGRDFALPRHPDELAASQLATFAYYISVPAPPLPTLSMQSHVKYTISILNQRLYLLNQLHKQGLNVSGLTQVFMALVVARLQNALPTLAGKLSADDLHKVDAVFSKARKWQLPSHTPNSADLIEQCDEHLFRAVLNPANCLHSMMPQRKI